LTAISLHDCAQKEFLPGCGKGKRIVVVKKGRGGKGKDYRPLFIAQ